MASGDKIRVALETDLESVSDEVTTITNTIGDSDSGLVNDVETLQTESSDYESRITTLEDAATTSIEITNILDSDTTMASISTTGYYIWTSLATDYASYLTSMTSNDIVYYDGSDWSLYLTYEEANATVYNLNDSASYQKSDSSWIEVGSGSGSNDVEITEILSDDTFASITTEGYYIWTETASDLSTYLSTYSVGDIAYYDGSDWEVYLTYENSPASVYNNSTNTSYEKYDGGWSETTAGSSETGKELSELYVYEASGFSSVSADTIIKFDTDGSTMNNGSDPITYSTSTGVATLPAGYIYRLEAALGYVETTGVLHFGFADSTISTSYGTNGGVNSSVNSMSRAVAQPATATIDLRDSSSDLSVGVVIGYMSGTGTYTNQGSSTVSSTRPVAYMRIWQVASKSIVYLPTSSFEITNDVSSEGQLLLSAGNDDDGYTAEWNDFTTRELDYGLFYAGSNYDVTSSSQQFNPFTTARVSNGDLVIDDDEGIFLTGGRTYMLSVYIRTYDQEDAMFAYIATNGNVALSQQLRLLPESSTSNITTPSSAMCFYTPSSDTYVGIIMTGGSCSLVAASSYLVVQEIPSNVYSLISAHEITIDNNTSASENDILVSDGSDNGTFKSASDLNILSMDLSSYTENDILTVDGSGDLSLQSISDLNLLELDSTSYSAGDTLVATGSGTTFTSYPYNRFCKIYRDSTTVALSSTGWHSGLILIGAKIVTDTDLFDNDSYSITVNEDGYYRVTANLSAETTADERLMFLISTVEDSGGNDGILGATSETGGTYRNMSASGIFYLESGTQLWMNVYTPVTGVIVRVEGDQGTTALQVEWVGPAS